MNSVEIFFSIIGLEYIFAFLVWPVLKAPRFIRWSIIIITIFVAMLGGYFLPPEAKKLKECVVLIGGLMAIRIYSYSQSKEKGSFIDYVLFLSVGLVTPYLVYSTKRYYSRVGISVWREILRVLLAVAVLPLIWTTAETLILTEIGRNSWTFNHLVLLFAVPAVFQAFGQCCLGVWRLLGLRAKPLIDNIFLSKTPAEFWRRWSWPIHVWLYRYIFIPTGGRNHRIRATLSAFLLMGFAHEIMAFVVIGRITGHWIISFFIGAMGVLISPQIETLALRGVAGKITARLATITFLIILSIFVFAAVDYIVPIYHRKIWLMW